MHSYVTLINMWNVPSMLVQIKDNHYCVRVGIQRTDYLCWKYSKTFLRCCYFCRIYSKGFYFSTHFLSLQAACFGDMESVWWGWKLGCDHLHVKRAELSYVVPSGLASLIQVWLMLIFVRKSLSKFSHNKQEFYLIYLIHVRPSCL